MCHWQTKLETAAMSGGLISGAAETITMYLPRPSVRTPSGSDRLATTTPDGRDVTIAEFCARVNDFGKVQWSVIGVSRVNIVSISKTDDRWSGQRRQAAGYRSQNCSTNGLFDPASRCIQRRRRTGNAE